MSVWDRRKEFLYGKWTNRQGKLNQPHSLQSVRSMAMSVMVVECECFYLFTYECLAIVALKHLPI